MSYDRIEWHSKGEGFPKKATPEDGGTHIGMFLTWIIQNDLIGKLYKKTSQESIDKVKTREMTGRDFLIEECDGRFYNEVLNNEGNEFVKYYYDDDNANENYSGDYAKVFDEYDNVYDVENSWENYDKIKPIIEMRYQEWKNNRHKSIAHRNTTMKINEIAQQISDGVLESFQKYGFKYRKAQREFVRKIKEADHIFSLMYTKKNDGTITIKPELIIQVKEIEAIYKSIAQIKGTPYLTLGNHLLTIRDYDGDDLNYKKKPTKEWLIENQEDINHLIKIIPEYLEEYILPYFDSNSSVSRVDELLNKYPEKMCVHNYMYPTRANIAIIAAKLNENPRYEELVNIYEERMVNAEENSKIEFYKLKGLLASGQYEK